jgi:hypothetical protein
MVEYKHSLSMTLIQAFRKVAEHAPKTGYFHIGEVDLLIAERTNLIKLQYWDLILKLGDEKNHGGRWLISKKGWQWLRGEIALPKHVWTYRGEVQKHEGKLVTVSDVTGGWKYKPEYAAEAVVHI